jgi:hypothetical protein
MAYFCAPPGFSYYSVFDSAPTCEILAPPISTRGATAIVRRLPVGVATTAPGHLAADCLRLAVTAGQTATGVCASAPKAGRKGPL